MARYQYVILSCAEPGAEAAFDQWYDKQHLGDVARVPGVVSARRYNVETVQATELAAPAWHSLAIYEVEAEDTKAAQAVLASIGAVAGTAAMPLSDAMTRTGMIQLLAGPQTGAA